MSDDLSELEKLANDMLRRVSAGDRRRLLLSIARRVQASQRARIAHQQAPDGARFAPRKAGQEDKPGAYPLKFLYPKGSAAPRLVLMKNWVHRGGLVTGYDICKGAARSFAWAKIARFLPVTAEDDAKPTGPAVKPRRLRDRAMFRKLSTARRLQAGGDDNEAWVGFGARDSRVAWIHQEGGRDKPWKNGKEIRYARRVLLGLSAADQAMVMDMLTAHVSGR